MAGALDGIRVLDLSRALAGPFAAMTLGDMGADVVKIEEPAAGDTTRGFPPFWNGISTYYLSTNRNKRGLTIDLASQPGQELLRSMASQADILIESFKTGAMERWGLGSNELLAENPRLIYCAISAAGREGPEKDRGGVDLLMQAYAGLMSITGEADGPPVRTGTSVVDLSTGANAAQGILAALYVRERTGCGQRIDVSLLGSTIAWMTYHAVTWFANGESPSRMGSRHPSVAPYGAFPTQDGFLVVAIAFDSHWRRFCGLVGRPELVDQPELATNAARIANRDLLESVMTEILAERSSTDWVTIMNRAAIPCSPINSVDTALQLPQVRHMGYVATVPHPQIPDLQTPGIHIGLSATPSTIRRHPPGLGEHSIEVLRDYGFSEARIGELLEAGVVSQG